MAQKFEIHLEEWNSALHLIGRGHKSSVDWIFNLPFKPKIYVLKDWKEENFKIYCDLNMKYELLSHGVHHYYDEKADRSPYFNQEGLPWPPSGGFFFRIMPLWYLKWAIKKSGVFWIHPHDLDENHPKLKNPIMNWKRHVGLKTARAKLERLLQEVKFE